MCQWLSVAVFHHHIKRYQEGTFTLFRVPSTIWKLYLFICYFLLSDRFERRPLWWIQIQQRVTEADLNCALYLCEVWNKLVNSLFHCYRFCHIYTSFNKSHSSFETDSRAANCFRKNYKWILQSSSCSLLLILQLPELQPGDPSLLRSLFFQTLIHPFMINWCVRLTQWQSGRKERPVSQLRRPSFLLSSPSYGEHTMVPNNHFYNS